MAERLRKVGISNRERPQEEEQERREHPVQSEGGAPGTKASAQKAASTRHTDRPAPPSNKVQGAFGKESD